MKKPDCARVLFTKGGRDHETAWCVLLKEPNRARLDNILFLHETPVLGDVIEIVNDPRADFPRFKRVVKSGNRYTMIVDYPARPDFKRLSKHLEKTLHVAGEGCYGPKDGEYGRLYLAVPKAVAPKRVFSVARQCVPGVVGILPRFGELPPAPKPVVVPPTLFDAIAANDIAGFRRLNETALKARDDHGRPLLFCAVLAGRTEIVKKLLALGADANDERWPPLLAAVMRDRPKEARLLIAAGADPQRARDEDGDPAVVVAAFRDNTAVLRVLLETKPSRDVISLALLEAAGNGNLPIAKLLVKHGGDPDWQSKKGNTPLAIARARKRREIVRYFKGLTALPST